VSEREPDAVVAGGVIAAAAPGPARRRAAARPVVSVCVVNWNCRDVLRECLQSLRDQPLGLDHEIIVVDNASTDGAADMVAAAFPEVRLIRNAANVGFARANNQAARAARGRYLFFLNNDTVVPPGVLHELVEYLDDHPDVVLVGPRLRDARGRVQASHRRAPTVATFVHRTWAFRVLAGRREAYHRYRRDDVPGAAPRDVDVLLGAALMTPADRFRALAGWDEDFAFGGEDLELCHRARRHGRVVYHPGIEMTHLGSVSTKRHPAFASPHTATGFAKYFRKTGASPASLVAYKLAVTLDAPPRLVARAVQYVWRRLRGRQDKAAKCAREMRGLLAFLTVGLGDFWRA
jgi:GT2 family glycosyltransferase